MGMVMVVVVMVVGVVRMKHQVRGDEYLTKIYISFEINTPLRCY
jgi:hypothetical protein